MVDFPSVDPTTRRLPDVVRAQLATDMADPAQVEGAVLGTRFNNRGDFVGQTAYALNDVVYTAGVGLFFCIQAHTSGTGAPTGDSAYWKTFGSTSKPANGWAATDLEQAVQDSLALANSSLQSVGLPDLPAGSTITVYYNSAWPARPTSRTDITVQWVGGTEATPPAGAIAGVDVWIRDAS